MLFSSHQVQSILQISKALLNHSGCKLRVLSSVSMVRHSSRVNSGRSRMSLRASTSGLVSQRTSSTNFDVLCWLPRTSSVLCSSGVKKFLNALILDARPTHHTWSLWTGADTEDGGNSFLALSHSLLVVNDAWIYSLRRWAFVWGS